MFTDSLYLSLLTDNKPLLDLRETGFIYALMSASAIVGVVEACSDGDIYMCGCREMQDVPDPQRGWTWGGCSDSVDNGELCYQLLLPTAQQR
jgi:hypothetical protein